MADARDFEDVYQTHYLSMLLYVRKRIPNQHDAEELTSEIFETAYRYYPSYDERKSSVATWLYVIAGSRLKNHYRNSRAPCADINELASYLSSADNAFDSIETAARLQQMRDVLADALDDLNERSRRAVVMKYFLDRPTEEIAAALGTTSGNIRAILSRALRQMEKVIGANNSIREEITHG